MRKGTLLILTGPVEHLFFICNDPTFYPRFAKDCFLGVNISSIKTGIEFDKTCLLRPGDHSFVSRPSYVFYEKAQIFGSESAQQRVATGEFRTHEMCGDRLFGRIIEGFTESPFVTPKILTYVNAYCRS